MGQPSQKPPGSECGSRQHFCPGAGLPLPPRDGVGVRRHSLPDFSEAKAWATADLFPPPSLAEGSLPAHPPPLQSRLPCGSKAEASKTSLIPASPWKGMLSPCPGRGIEGDAAPHPALEGQAQAPRNQPRTYSKIGGGAAAQEEEERWGSL